MEATYDNYTAEYSSQPPNVGGCLLKTLFLLGIGLTVIVFALGAMVGSIFV